MTGLCMHPRPDLSPSRPPRPRRLDGAVFNVGPGAWQRTAPRRRRLKRKVYLSWKPRTSVVLRWKLRLPRRDRAFLLRAVGVMYEQHEPRLAASAGNVPLCGQPGPARASPLARKALRLFLDGNDLAPHRTSALAEAMGFSSAASLSAPGASRDLNALPAFRVRCGLQCHINERLRLPRSSTSTFQFQWPRLQATPTATDAYLAAVQARLARRQLPTVAANGLILYALQLPANGYRSPHHPSGRPAWAHRHGRPGLAGAPPAGAPAAPPLGDTPPPRRGGWGWLRLRGL